MAKVKKMAFGGLGSVMGGVANAVKGAAPAAAQAAARPGPMAQGQGPQSQMAAQMAAQMAQQAAAKDVAARQVAMQRPGPMAQGQGAMGMGVKAPANALSPMVKTAANVGRMGGAALGKFMKSGGKVSSASSRADGIASKGKTKGRMV